MGSHWLHLGVAGRRAFAFSHIEGSRTEHRLLKKHTQKKQQQKNWGSKLSGAAPELQFTTDLIYLSWDSVVWSPPWSADTELCHSSQSVPCQAAARSTLSEPSGASGPRQSCPTAMGLYLTHRHTLRHVVFDIEAITCAGRRSEIIRQEKLWLTQPSR